VLGTRGSGLDAVWEKISLGRTTDGEGSVLGGGYFYGSCMKGGMDTTFVFFWQQVSEGTLYAINGKRDLMKLNACTSLQHTLSYGGDEDLTFMISLGHD